MTVSWKRLIEGAFILRWAHCRTTLFTWIAQINVSFSVCVFFAVYSMIVFGHITKKTNKLELKVGLCHFAIRTSWFHTCRFVYYRLGRTGCKNNHINNHARYLHCIHNYIMHHIACVKDVWGTVCVLSNVRFNFLQGTKPAILVDIFQ